MKTDWDLIRRIINTAIDACESVDKLGVLETDRGRSITLENGTTVSVFDFLQSAITYPDTLKNSIVRARHELKDNQAYTPETAKTLVNIAALCSEIIGASDLTTKVKAANSQSRKEQSIVDMVNGLAEWYENHMVPGLKKAMSEDKK